jgi:hypothetical protein
VPYRKLTVAVTKQNIPLNALNMILAPQPCIKTHLRIPNPRHRSQRIIKKRAPEGSRPISPRGGNKIVCPSGFEPPAPA